MQSTTWKSFQNKRSSSSKNYYIWQKIASFESLLQGEGQLPLSCSFDFWKIENTYLYICFQFSNLWHTYTESHPNRGAEGQNKRSSSSKRRFIQQKLASFEF